MSTRQRMMPFIFSTLALLLYAACTNDSTFTEAPLAQSCSSQCLNDYTFCFQLTGDKCSCYPDYVSCMHDTCSKPPAFPAPSCLNAVPPSAAPNACTRPDRPTSRCDTFGGWHWCGCPDPNDPVPRGWVCGLCQ